LPDRRFPLVCQLPGSGFHRSGAVSGRASGPRIGCAAAKQAFPTR
jgi:hypothetical protein